VSGAGQLRIVPLGGSLRSIMHGGINRIPRAIANGEEDPGHADMEISAESTRSPAGCGQVRASRRHPASAAATTPGPALLASTRDCPASSPDEPNCMQSQSCRRAPRRTRPATPRRQRYLQPKYVHDKHATTSISVRGSLSASRHRAPWSPGSTGNQARSPPRG